MNIPSSSHIRRQARMRRAMAGVCFLLCPLLSVSGKLLAQAAPETNTGFTPRPALAAHRFVAVTANPHASEAAAEILRAGGSAVDAAIAAQMVLTLVEPQSSGIGGGGFMLHWHARQRALTTYDGRETAPMDVDDTLLLDDAGRPLPFFEAAVGGRAVGVPGLVKMLALAHARHGRLPWTDLFTPAMRLARQGFSVSPRLHALLTRDTHLKHNASARAYFHDGAGQVHPVGHVLRNPVLADTLERIAKEGAQALYTGDIARDLVKAVQQDSRNPGRLAQADLIGYQPVERAPVCRPYRHWIICGMGPPSSGGITVTRILELLEPSPVTTYRPVQDMPDARAIRAYAQAAQIAWAERDAWIADPEYAGLPPSIGRDRLTTAPYPPNAQSSPAPCMALGPEHPATSHLTIVDRDGNVVALTSSIENAFGAKIMVHGFLLNNQLTDFSFSPAGTDGLGQPCTIRNRVEAGKRPRSSMAPTMVFRRLPGDQLGELQLALGSAGGPAIIHHVATRLIAMLDWHLPIDRAFMLPHFFPHFFPHSISRSKAHSDPQETAIHLEKGRLDSDALVHLETQLRSMGMAIAVDDHNSGLTGIQRKGKGWIAAADPRREGMAAGE